MIGDDFILQQNNAPIHTAKIVKKHLQENLINILEWPPQSPDLSPIENMWSILKLRIAEHRPRNIKELENLIEKTWQLFSIDECRKYMLSLPDRLAKLSLRNGHHCGY